MNNPSAVAPLRSPGRLLLILGLALAPLGVIGYVLQLWAQRLITPWYMPLLGTLGVACVLVALWQKFTVWRVLGLVLVLLLAGAEWMVLLGTRLPAYAGPITVGQPFPVFATTLADGSKFTQRDLQGGQNHVLVFFRGRW